MGASPRVCPGLCTHACVGPSRHVCPRVCVHACAWGPFFLQSLHVQKSDVDLMRTKLRRLEEENSRKDRQIEQLLDPSRVRPCSLLPRGGALAVGGAWQGRGRPRVVICPSAFLRARILFGLWQRKGPIPAG